MSALFGDVEGGGRVWKGERGIGGRLGGGGAGWGVEEVKEGKGSEGEGVGALGVTRMGGCCKEV